MLNSLFVRFPGTIMNRAVRAAKSPWWDFFERSLIYTVPIYPREALCRDEKLRRTSARDTTVELLEELFFFPSVGCISIGWQRHVHLRVERRMTLACDRGQG